MTSLHSRIASAVIAMAALGVCATAQGPEREVVILSPDADAILRGKTPLSADVHPSELQVSQVVFFVDGERVCAVPTRPYHCEFDAGVGLTQREVYVVAELRGGGRLTKSVTTSALPNATFRGAVDLVSVSVHVRDRNGRPVNGLGAESFRAFEDGQPQSIVSLATEEVPADLVLALDTSGSMTPALGELKSAALGFLRALRPIDRPRVASFTTGLTLLTPANASAEQRQEAIERLTAGGNTALYDSIIEAAEALRTAGSRRAVIVFTDGDDTASYGSITSVRTALQTNKVVLYIIAQGKAAADSRLKNDLSTLAFETGGLPFFAAKMSTLSEHFSEILSDLSTEYVVGYSPQVRVGDGAWRKIRVEVGRPEDRYRVRAREGYLAVARSGGR